jgi:hypothetical protein
MRKIVVHDKDEAPMGVTNDRLFDGRVVEADVVHFAEMFLRKDNGYPTLGHVAHIGTYDVNLAGVAIMAGQVRFHEAVSGNVL